MLFCDQTLCYDNVIVHFNVLQVKLVQLDQLDHLGQEDHQVRQAPEEKQEQQEKLDPPETVVNQGPVENVDQQEKVAMLDLQVHQAYVAAVVHQERVAREAQKGQQAEMDHQGLLESVERLVRVVSRENRVYQDHPDQEVCLLVKYIHL